MGRPGFANSPGLWSGVRRLVETPLVANGSVADTILRFPLHNASGDGLPEHGGAGTLALQAGTAPTYDRPGAFLGSLDNGCLFNAGGFFAAGDNDLGDVTTQDGIDEILFRFGSGGGTMAIAGKNNASNNGVHLYQSGTSLMLLLGSGGSYEQSSVVSLAAGALCLVLSVWDKSGSALIYVNAVAGSAADISGLGSFTVANPLSVGARTGGTIPFNGDVYYYARHTKASWLDTHTQAALAASRLALLTGSRPLISIPADLYPAAAGSTSTTYQERPVSGAQRLFSIGAGAPRFSQREDSDGRVFTGALVEAESVNSCLQSETAGTTWTTSDAAVASDSTTAPNGKVTADTLTASANNGYLKQAFAAITAVSRTYSHYIKRNGGSDVGGKIQIIKTSTTDVIAEQSFTATSAWQRVSVTGTCVLNDTEIRCVITTNGESIYLWGAQFEAGPVPLSYVTTTTDAVTKAVCSLRYSAANLFTDGASGALRFRFLSPTFTPTRSHYLIGASDGGAAGDSIAVYLDTDGHLNVATAADGGNAGATSVDTNFCDDHIHDVIVSWQTNDLRVCVDGVWGTADTTVDIPDDLDRLEIGMDCAGANQAGPVLVGDIRAFNRPLPSWSAGGGGFVVMT